MDFCYLRNFGLIYGGLTCPVKQIVHINEGKVEPLYFCPYITLRNLLHEYGTGALASMFSIHLPWTLVSLLPPYDHIVHIIEGKHIMEPNT